MRPPCSWQEALQPGAECLLHLLQEEGQEEDVLLTWRCHTNVKRKGAKGAQLHMIQGWLWERASWGSEAPCRAVPCRLLTSQHSRSGVGLCSGEVPCRTGVRATSSLCSCFLVSAGLSVCVHCFLLFVVSIWHGCVKKQEIAAPQLESCSGLNTRLSC